MAVEDRPEHRHRRRPAGTAEETSPARGRQTDRPRGPERGRAAPRRGRPARRDTQPRPGPLALVARRVPSAPDVALPGRGRLRPDLRATGADERLAARPLTSRTETPPRQ